MTSRPYFILAVAFAFILAFPILPISVEAGEETTTEPPSRYGFTPDLKQVATLTAEAICVDAGDIDNRNNDDLVVGFNGGIDIYTNNGGSGSSFGMTKDSTITTAGYYITKVKVVDYDNDADMDIIALGQDEYVMANENGAGMTETVGAMRVYYFENTPTGFILEDSFDFDDVFYVQSGINPTGAWFWTDGKYDFDVADVDGDNDLDTLVIYNRDTDSNAANLGEDIVLSLLSYDGTAGLTRSIVGTVSAPASWNIGCFVRFADFDLDNNPDIVYTYGGVSNGNWFMIKVYARFHTGSGANWGTAIDLDPNSIMEGDGSFPTIPYALSVGNFAGQDPWDVAVSINDNRNVNPAFTDTQVYIIKKKNPTLDKLGFDGPQAAHSEDYNYQVRGMAIGNLDNAGADDVVAFTKQDDWTDEDYYNAPEEYGLSILAGRSAIPVRFNELRRFETEDSSLPTSHVLKDVAVGEFDGNTTYDDLVYVGSHIIVGLTTFPPNNPPQKLSVSMNPSPVRNNNETCTVNITVQDLDKAGDLDRIEVDFTPYNMKFVSVSKPTGYHETDNTIAYYEFQIKVASWIPEADYEVGISMYDRSPRIGDVKSTDTFTFRVKQYNREPLIVLQNRTVTVNEDETTYIENIYDWFMDEDVRDGYDEEPLNLTLKTLGGQWLSSVEYFEAYKVELVNASGIDPENWVLRITPHDNFNHDLYPFAADVFTMKATDSGGLESEELVMKLKIAPVNDLPVIPAQGRPKENYTYQLEQDDDGFTSIIAHDRADDPDDKRLHLSFSLIYDDPTDESWLYIDEQKIFWRPTNDHVGPHLVTLVVNDTIDTVEQELWFNVSNVVDAPEYLWMENSTDRVDLTGGIQSRYLFYVYEHEEFNLTIKATDVDIDIGEQSEIVFKCNLTLGDGTYLDVDDEDPTKAYLHFWAEKRYGYPPTYEPDFMPIDTEIILIDQDDPDIWSVLPIRIRIINVNDPPLFVSISDPEEGFHSDILYNVKFSAGSVIDPDTDLNDTLTYEWDFDISNDFQTEAEGLDVIWDFPSAGSYTITLRVTDTFGNFREAQVNITVAGIRDDDDFDNDGMSNQWEDDNGYDKYNAQDAWSDTDDDEIPAIYEFINGTDPRNPDTDGDGVDDGKDWDPLDAAVVNPPSEEKSWVKDNFGLFIILLIIILLIILVVIGGLIFLIISRNRKKAEEEEQRRQQAEEMQKSLYEGQDLYADLPETLETPEVQAAPEAPALPPQAEEGDLDDIFGGAGILPTEPDAGALPPGPEAAPPAVEPAPIPEQPAPPQQEPTSDLTDLLD